MADFRSSAAYRIAFTYSAAFALGVLLLGIAVYFAADAEFRRERDRAIAEEMGALSRERGRAKLAQEIAERETARATRSFGYALFDSGGRRIAGSMAARMPATGFGTIAFLDPQEGPDTARALTVALADGDRLVVGVDSETVEDIDATILALFGGAFVVMLAFSAVGALLVGRYLRRRLATIGTTAQAIVAGDLGQRVLVTARDDEFDQVGRALNAMLDRIAQLMENLRQVSSDVAHDLRTPLLRLRNQLELVGSVEGAAAKAIEQGDDVLALFAAILRIAEVEGGALSRTFRPVDLGALTTDMGESYQPAIADSGRSLGWEIEGGEIAGGIVVLGDRELIAQGIINLLDNARLHTPPGTAILLALDSGKEWARLSVADTGPGVPAPERARILQRFARGEASRTTPGNGLGLSLVAAVAAAHGGTVTLGDNEPGLRVTMALPRMKP